LEEILHAVGHWLVLFSGRFLFGAGLRKHSLE
jgi:hypothetical protein